MTDLDKLLQMASTDNISDELLAAYIDGNTSAEENEIIQASMPTEDLADIQEIAQDSLSFEEQLHFYDGDYGYWELGIPPVLDNFDDTLLTKETTTMEEKIYGQEKNFALNPFDAIIDQGYNNTCAIRCQEIILRDYGILVPQESLMSFAEQNGWYDPDPFKGGTPLLDTGNLLESCGIPVERHDSCNIYDIISELRQGHRVIVGVDANELWANKEGFWKRNLEKTIYKLEDKLIGESANHALIVAGVRVNPDDPSDIHVVLTDPGTGDMCIEYTYKEFKEAWKDSNGFMVSTQIPAPLQYNSETHQMETSNFASNYRIEELPFDNKFPSTTIHSLLSGHTAEYSANEPIDWKTEKDEDAKDNGFGDGPNDIKPWIQIIGQPFTGSTKPGINKDDAGDDHEDDENEDDENENDENENDE